MAKPIRIGERCFKSQREALAFVASVRDRYNDHEEILGADRQFLLDLLACHPEASDKIGPGLLGILVATDSVYGRTRHFVVQRVDGTSTDFSFLACIKGSNERRDRLQALRVAISDQVSEFKRNAFGTADVVPCAVRGTPTAFADAHVDHVPPETFLALVMKWLNENKLALKDVAISAPADNQTVSSLVDAGQLASWRSHHSLNAALRITSRAANLSDVRKAPR